MSSDVVSSPATASSVPAHPIANPVQSTASRPAPVSLATAVNQQLGRTLPIPKGLTGFNTRDLESGYFHGLIYSETNARKTTSAALFSKPEDTLIILARQKEQLIPLKKLNYNVLHVDNGEALNFALTYPEQAASQLLGMADWASRPERTLIIDDITESVALLLDENSTNSETGKEYKDMRKVYGEAGKDLRAAVQSLRRKQMHLILIALAKVSQKPLTNEETIAPDLPPSMAGLLTTDLEFVFFIQKSNWKFVTDTTFINYKETDEKGKETSFRREIMAKNKLSLDLVNKGVIAREEAMDLRSIWERVKSAKVGK